MSTKPGEDQNAEVAGGEEALEVSIEVEAGKNEIDERQRIGSVCSARAWGALRLA
ncbi:MAG: hypothetical protein U0610_29005 [bacterium]